MIPLAADDEGWLISESALAKAQADSAGDRELEIMQEIIKVRKALEAVKVRLGREK